MPMKPDFDKLMMTKANVSLTGYTTTMGDIDLPVNWNIRTIIETLEVIYRLKSTQYGDFQDNFPAKDSDFMRSLKLYCEMNRKYTRLGHMMMDVERGQFDAGDKRVEFSLENLIDIYTDIALYAILGLETIGLKMASCDDNP